MRLLIKRLNAWIYVISQVKHEALVPDLKGLLETAKEGPKPKKINSQGKKKRRAG